MDIAGFLLSLVVLPPNAFFDISPDGNDAVKVIYGKLGWIDSNSVLIERTRVSGLPGCAVPMLVDSPAGDINSGNEGAVFVRMRPSSLFPSHNAMVTSAADMMPVLNAIPSCFLCEARDHEFSWQVHPDGTSQDIGGKGGNGLANSTAVFSYAAP